MARATIPGHRRPLWSGPLTRPLSRWIPESGRPLVLPLIKAIHTLAFALIGGAIVLFVWDGARQRTGTRASVALAIAVAETAVYVSNNQVCPLTPLAEELGAESGSVADIFLPDWFSRRIPLFGGSALLLGVALHLRGRFDRRHRA